MLLADVQMRESANSIPVLWQKLIIFALVKVKLSIPPFHSNNMSVTYMQNSLFLFMKHNEESDIPFFSDV
jgi:hypothetical protein